MILRHDGYIAAIEIDEEDGALVGRVINAAGPITFEGRDVAELKREFARSVEVYREVCREEGIDPVKPYSGKFNVRLDPAAHARVAAAAGKSMTVWIAETLARAAARELEGA